MSNFLYPKLVRASAGTGKTFQLSNRFIELVLLGEEPDRILATTFTKKAAGEIRLRILERLYQASLNPDNLSVLASQIGVPNLNLEQVTKALEKIIQAQHRLLICTLDSFFVTIAKSFSSELQLPFGWNLLDPADNVSIIEQAVQEVCDDQITLTELINLVQKNPGSRQVHHLLVDKVSSLQDLFYDTTVDLWTTGISVSAPLKDELTAAIEMLKVYPIPKTKSGTPNLNFQKALQKINQIIAENSSWEEDLLEEGRDLLAKLLKGEPTTYSRAEVSQELCQIFEPISRQIRFQTISRIEQQTKALWGLIAKIALQYQQQATHLNVISFQDIKRKIHQAMIAQNLTQMFYRIDTRISHLLLDEFQDTSLAEWQLIEPIAAEVLSYADGSHSFFCVGDTKQAIYAFRGGVAEIFDQLEFRWSHLVKESLDVSRRSAPVILDFVNLIFSNLETNRSLTDYQQARSAWQKRFAVHYPHQQDLEGYVYVESTVEDRNAIQLMVEKVLELSSVNPRITIGVLVRYQKTVPICLNELKRKGIIASGEGGSAISDSPLVSVLLSFLWFLDHPSDSIAHFHVTSSPVADIFDLTKSDTLVQKDQKAKEIRQKIFSAGLTNFLLEITEKLSKYSSSRDLLKLNQLTDVSIKFVLDSKSRLSDFVKYIRELRIPDSGQSKIQVMTIHKSKGLEFDAVILCDLDYEIYRYRKVPVVTQQVSPLDTPTRVIASVKENWRQVDPELELPYQQQKNAQVVDALSVLYVALTRARQGLYLYLNSNSNRNTIGKLISVSTEPKEIKTPKDSINLQANLIYQQGQRDWFTPDQALISNSEILNQEEKVRIPIFSKQSNFAPRNLPRITPSKASDKITFHSYDHSSRKARDRGRMLHRLFEGVEWIEDYNKKIPELICELTDWSIRHRIYSGDDVKKAVNIFLEKIKTTEINHFLSKKNYSNWQADTLTVFPEKSFSVLTKQGLSQGLIDRLVVGKQNGKVVFAEIIDFKTDRFPDQNFISHREQLNFYREAIAKIYQLKPENIKTKLVYLESLEIRETDSTLN